jgi:DNA-binding NarL/FixJ family response regulator
MATVRVLVAAGRTLFRQGLVALIASHVEFHVVSEAADGVEARRLTARELPDLILLDSELPNADGPCAIVTCLRAMAPRAAIVVLGEADKLAGSEAEAESALRAERSAALSQGAVAFLPARADSSELLRLLIAAAATRACTDDEGDAAAPLGVAERNGGRRRITEREQSIIAMIAQGLCNKEVAHRLGISTQTVKNHVSRLLEKLALADRTQLAVYAIEHKFEF